MATQINCYGVIAIFCQGFHYLPTGGGGGPQPVDHERVLGGQGIPPGEGGQSHSHGDIPSPLCGEGSLHEHGMFILEIATKRFACDVAQPGIQGQGLGLLHSRFQPH